MGPLRSKVRHCFTDMSGQSIFKPSKVRIQLTMSIFSSEPPSFVTPLESQVALPNSKVRFKSTYKGTPPFMVKWFKDDTELITGPTCFSGLEGLSCFLELYSVGMAHSGIYSCQVSNDAGSIRCSANLMVKGWTIVLKTFDCILFFFFFFFTLFYILCHILFFVH